MKFVVISDTHGLHENLQGLPSGDVIIHAGDFCHFGGAESRTHFLSWYADLNYRYKILISGNHDFYAAENPNSFLDELPTGVTYLNDSGTEIAGLKCWGSPVQPDLIGWAFGRARGEQMKAHWDLIPLDTDILITHTPPRGILDQSSSGKVLGCEELLKKMVWIKPRIHIFGHIHASYGQQRIDDTLYINGSNMNSAKGLVNPPFTFEL